MELRDSRVYYGTCSTAASESEKVVEVLNPVFIDGQNNRLDLMVGDILVVKLDNGNTTSNPTIKLRVKGNNQNISVSADAGLTTLINERYDWAPQEIMAFACVYCGPINEGEDPINSYAWKPIELPIASDDTYGVTKLITNMENLVGNENQPVSYDIIQNLIGNSSGSLGLTYNNENGNLTLGTSDSKTVNIPMPRTKTSQLTNDGEARQQGEENTDDRYWSSRTNNYVMTQDLGIGYAYIPNGPNASQQVIKSFVPYSKFKPGGSDSQVNIIRIGRDALKAYQNDNPIEPDPYVRLYGKHIDLAMDSTSGVVGIGLCNIKTEPGSYTRNYLFKPDNAIFGLPLKANGGVEANSIIYKNKELEDRLTNFKVQVYITPKLTYKASSATPTNSTKPTLDGEEDDNLALKITDIPTGYRPIAMVGYNLQSDGDEVHFANLWECFVLKSGDDYYIRYGIYNSRTAAIKVWVEFKVLFVKDSLVSPQKTIK